MKKYISILLAMIIVVLCCLPSKVFAIENRETLSYCTDAEILAFIAQSNIQIPDGFAPSEAELVSIIRRWIRLVEEDPNYVFVFNHTDLHEVSNAVKDAVIAYYEIVPATSQMPSPSTRASHGLLYSTVVDASSSVQHYNCYSYALGITDQPYNPGMFCNNPITVTHLRTNDIAAVNQRIKDDLKSLELGYFCARWTHTLPSNDMLNYGDSVLCVRLGDDGYDYDYHFMRLIGSGDWYHKPGSTAVLKYDYVPTASLDWIQEGYTTSGFVVRNEDFLYDSLISYFIYSSAHEYGAGVATGHDYHSGLKHYYQYQKTCEDCNEIYTYYNVVPCTNCDGDIGALNHME